MTDTVADFDAVEEVALPPGYETDEQIEARIDERFEVLEMLTKAVTDGSARSLIVSGPPGLGKSYTIEQTLREWDPFEENHSIVKGYVRATGLVKLLYRYRAKNQVLVFDDSDSIFSLEDALNFLKTACDTTERRRISWRSESILVDEETAEAVPTVFDFEGGIVFITNLDFDDLIMRGHKLSPHLQALISRSHYVDLAMKTRRDYLVRIKQQILNGILDPLDLNWHEQADVLNFIEEFQHCLRELSLRMAIKLGGLRKTNKTNWEKLARITCCK